MRYLFAAIAIAAAGLAGSQPAEAWSARVTISARGDAGCSVPKIARGSDGRMLVVYRRKEPDWRLLYRERSPQGVWGPVETVSVPWSERADIVEDPLGRPFMLYTATGAGGKTDLIAACRSGGTWTVLPFTATSDCHEDYARIAVGPGGRMHLVYTRSWNGDQGDVIYRVWNGSWSGETVIGSISGSTYYHRPDISVDSDAKVHVIWERTSRELTYRRFDGVSWQPQMVIGTTTEFFAYPKIAAATPASVVAVTFDQANASTAVIKYTSSGNGGADWSALQYLHNGHYPSMDAQGGKAHLVNQWGDARSTGYRMWNTVSWNAAERCSPIERWHGWADVAADMHGYIHCVYDDGEGGIGYTTNGPVPPPQPCAAFTARESDSAAQLSWVSPADPDFYSVVVRASTSGYPSGPASGTPVCDVAGLPGAPGVFSHTGLVNGTTYYYSAFARSASGSYSTAAHARAAPRAMTCGDVKLLEDGMWVSLAGKSVTAVFPGDGCLYIQDPGRTSGIRTSLSPVGLAVGDIVNVSGAISTRKPDGINPSERHITGAAVHRVSGGVPLDPLAMNCRAVGGGPTAPFVPGVRDGVGLNNIGLLVEIAGRVTLKIGTYVYVDDGSNIPDTSGRIGVMVKCPDTNIPVSAGDIVSVTGVVVGSVPSGWSANRRLIHIRDYSDLRRVSGL